MDRRQLIRELAIKFQCSERERFNFLESSAELAMITPNLDLSGSPLIAASMTVSYLEKIGRYWPNELNGIEILEELLQ